MSLQVRLRHPLGERWIDLPDRGVDHPLAVGRAGTADVQVPSVTVGQRHCVLFVHEGRWVVQDVAGGGPGTYVNGSRVTGAAFLSIGDVVTLGPDAAAPALEIDPAGSQAGRTGQPAVGAALPVAEVPAPEEAAPEYSPAPPHAALQHAPPAAYPPGYPAYPGGYAVPASAPPAPVADGTLVDWPTDATPRYYTPRRRPASGGSGGVVVGMLLAVLITAGAGYWLYRSREKAAPAVTVAPPSPPQGASPAQSRVRDDTAAPPSIFDPSQRSAPPRTTTRPTTRVAAAPAPQAPPQPTTEQGNTMKAQPGADPDMSAAGPSDAAPAQDSAATAPVPTDDADWKQVEAATHFKDEAKAILQFDDYARTHPGAPADKLAAFTDQMMDRIWFERIENLCEQREDLNKKIQETDKDLSEETDEAYKKRVLVPLRQQYVTRLQNVEEELTQNMKYQENGAPNLLDDAELDKLRQTRDPQYFVSWKDRILAHIRRTHGELPWVATKTR
jgi:hypothetical protein